MLSNRISVEKADHTWKRKVARICSTNVDELDKFGQIEKRRKSFILQGQNKHHLAAVRSIQLCQVKSV
jgi:hypothetical protein